MFSNKKPFLGHCLNYLCVISFYVFPCLLVSYCFSKWEISTYLTTMTKKNKTTVLIISQQKNPLKKAQRVSIVFSCLIIIAVCYFLNDIFLQCYLRLSPIKMEIERNYKHTVVIQFTKYNNVSWINVILKSLAIQ